MELFKYYTKMKNIVLKITGTKQKHEYLQKQNDSTSLLHFVGMFT